MERRPMKINGKKRKKVFTENFSLYILALPGVIALIAFSYIPLTGLVMAFKEYNFKGGIYFSPWSDPIFKNFQFFFNNFEMALRATRNTVFFNIAFFVGTTVFAVAMAIMLSEIGNKTFGKIAQSMMFFPFFMSWMVAGSILQAILSEETGVLNSVIQSITGETFNFYASPTAWIAILIICEIWHSAGYTAIIYYAVVSGIDTSLYEAAQIDGANKWQSIRKITIPLLKPTVIILFLLAVGNCLKGGFGMIIGLTNLNPLLYRVTDFIDVYVYRAGVQNGEMAFASAISLYQSIFGLIFVLVCNKVVSKIEPDATLF